MSHSTLKNPKPLAPTFGAYVFSPKNFSGIEGVASEIFYRLPGFTDFGMSGDEMVEALCQLGPTIKPTSPKWISYFVEYGHQTMEKGNKAEKEGNYVQAERTFLDASFWYFLARFPHIFSDAGQEAYRLHQNAYLRASKYFEGTFEILDIEVDGKWGRGYLRLPNDLKEKIPAILISGGVDTWKSELEVHSISNAFLKQGMATLTIDIPGTGDCPLFASPTSEKWFYAAFQMLKKHPQIDSKKLGCYGLSFGGYWSTKLAFSFPELSGIVNNGGPIHLTFQPEWLKALPLGLIFILKKMFGLDQQADHEILVRKCQELSLFNTDEILANKNAPILNINGEEDEVVPISEISFLQNKGVKQDSLIFGEDRHVASRNWKLHEPFAVQWMLGKIGRRNSFAS